ncbi:MAG: class II aldolase/adducin family protein [Candidatus Marinimicrobia bacterium]|nr:class II aldolase/adducin family protein [Candidatus Neomarinimicrobiota bacterium]
MPEVYIGTKFETVFSNSDIPKYGECGRIRFWGKKFAEMGMSPLGPEGNLSFRTDDGFIVTATASHISNLQENDFIEVIQVNIKENTIHVKGCKEPSSESFMHYAIYQQRPDINVIFHTHDYVVMDNQFELKIPETAKEQKYGTMDLVNEVLKVSKEHEYFIIKNHGIIALGRSINEAGEKIASAHSSASAIEN